MKHSRPEDPSVQQRRQRPSARGLCSDTDSAVYHITWHRDPLLRFAAANLEEGHWPCLFDLVGKAKPGDLEELSREPTLPMIPCSGWKESSWLDRRAQRVGHHIWSTTITPDFSLCKFPQTMQFMVGVGGG